MAIRGSVTKEDWLLSDLAIATNFGMKLTPRYSRAKRDIKKVLDDFKGYKVIVTGHSLGSTLAELFYDKIKETHPNSEVYIYNRGTGFIEEFPEDEPRDSNKHHFHSYGDPLSGLYLNDKGANHKVVIPKNVNVHGLKNFM
jgi:hypothetical protein